jgi:thiamine-monophosphate kinase
MGELPGLEADGERHLRDRYWLPRPRQALGRGLVGLAHAAIDVSDGLLADLGHIAEVSHVAASIRADRLPLSAAAKAAVARDPGLIERILTGGDDYELLFTAPPQARPAIEALALATATPVAAIGEIRTGSGVRAIGADGSALRFARAGYRHF